MRNLVPAGVGTKLDQAHQLLTQAVHYLQSIADNTTPAQTAARKERFKLSISDSQPYRDAPYPRNVVVGMVFGGDTAGRGTLDWGADDLAVWIPASWSQFPSFSGVVFEIPGGVTIGFTPPANTTKWDVTLFIESGGPR